MRQDSDELLNVTQRSGTSDIVFDEKHSRFDHVRTFVVKQIYSFHKCHGLECFDVLYFMYGCQEGCFEIFAGTSGNGCRLRRHAT